MIHQATVSVISIATGSHLEHWTRQATSVDAHLFADRDLTITLFTDRPKDAREHVLRLERVDKSYRVAGHRIRAERLRADCTTGQT